MGKGRLEAFSDGVIAIIITIMVLELKVPRGSDLAALRPLIPVFLSYILSFLFVGIYWNNHHHMLHAVRKINGTILWLNMHLLFWLSIIPFVTSWMGSNHFVGLPVALYGGVLLMCAVAFTLLARALVTLEGKGSPLALAIGRDYKGTTSLVLYVLAIPLALVNTWLAFALFVTVAILWFLPDRRIEKRTLETQGKD